MTDNNHWKAQPFTHLRGTVKGHFDEEVGPCTLFVGSNQSGKSGRLIAVRYAAAGVNGYSVGANHGSEIAQLAPNGSEEFFCELSGPSGVARFEVKQDGGKWKDPDPKLADFQGELKAHIEDKHRGHVLPLVSMSDLLTLGPDLGRRALIKRFGESDKVPEPVALQDAQKSLWEEVRDEVAKLLTKKGDEPDPSEILVGMNKAFAKRKRDEGSKIRALEKALDEKRDLLAQQAAGAEQLPELKAQLVQARAWESVAHLRARLEQLEADKVRYREAAAPYQAAEAQAEKRNADRASEQKTLTDAIATAQRAVDQASKSVADQKDKLSWGTNLVGVIEQAASHVGTHEEAPCPLCKNEFLPHEALQFIKPAVENRAESVKAAEAELATAQAGVSAAQADLQKWQHKISQEDGADRAARSRLEQEATRIMSAEKEIQAAMAQANPPANYQGPTATELAKEIEDLEEAQRARAQLEADTADLRTRKATRDMAKEMENETKVLLDNLIRQVKATAEAAVNKYMPTGMQAVVDLDKNAWNVLDQRGEARNKHTMCGFEANSAVPALAAAYTDGSPLRVLTLDDPDIDGVGLENAERFFGALMEAVQKGHLTQVFCAGNRLEPVLDKLAAMGWVIIRTDDDVAVRAAEQAPAQVLSPASITPPVPVAEPTAEVSQETAAAPSVNLYMDGGIPRL